MRAITERGAPRATSSPHKSTSAFRECDAPSSLRLLGNFRLRTAREAECVSKSTFQVTDFVFGNISLEQGPEVAVEEHD
jgi:hypothetical protein